MDKFHVTQWQPHFGLSRMCSHYVAVGSIMHIYVDGVSLHLAEKHFPENHLPEKHFPERSFSRIYNCQKSHLPEWTLAWNYICLNEHLFEITFARMNTCLKLHLPEWTTVRNYISPKIFQSLHLPECTFGQNYIFPKAYFPDIIHIKPKIRYW